MSNGFFAYVSRMKNIDRWALMRNSSRENVQEHSHMVAVIAHALAVIRRDVLNGDADPEHCAAAALLHDATEIFTGDMPTPVKYQNEVMHEAYRRIEEAAAERLLDTLPDAMRPAYEKLLEPDDEETCRIVKAADTISAYIKCVEELKAGNGEFKLAARQTREKLNGMKMPEVDYFMLNLMPAFELTLDELEG